MLSAYNSELARRNGLGYVVLGAMTPDEAAQQAMPKSSIRSTPGFTQAVYDDIVSAAQSGQFQAFNPAGCQGVSTGGNIKIIQSAGGLALNGTSMGLSAAGITSVAGIPLAPFTFGISAIIGLFPLFFAHHAAAVAKEQRIICAAVPAAQNYLQEIETAVQSGKATPEHGIQAMQSLLSDFQSTVAPIIKNDAHHCNAACVWVKELIAIVAYQNSVFADINAQQQAAAAAAKAPAQVTSGNAPAAAPVISSGSTMVLPPSSSAPAAASASPNWLGIAALLVGGFFVWRAI